jgi:hypothetical protein
MPLAVLLPREIRPTICLFWNWCSVGHLNNSGLHHRVHVHSDGMFAALFLLGVLLLFGILA